MLSIEVLILVVLIVWYDRIYTRQISLLNIDAVCLRVQALVIIPSELMYANAGTHWLKGRFNYEEFKDCRMSCVGFFMGCLPCFCCYTPAILLSSLPSLCNVGQKSAYKHPSVRMGLSLIEWIFLIIWAISIPERSKFLFSSNYGLAVFIVSGICYFIHTQYRYLFPDFSLPHNVSIRSIYGYAFNGELSELQRSKVSKKFERMTMEWDDDNPANSKLPNGIPKDSTFANAFYGDLEALKVHKWRDTEFKMGVPWIDTKRMTYTTLAYSNKQYHVVKWIEENAKDGVAWQGKICNDMTAEIARTYITADFWDSAPSGEFWVMYPCCTPAMYALSMGQYHVVEYLEREKGAKLHRLIFNAQNKYKTMNEEFARQFFREGHF